MMPRKVANSQAAVSSVFANQNAINFARVNAPLKSLSFRVSSDVLALASFLLTFQMWRFIFQKVTHVTRTNLLKIFAGIGFKMCIHFTKLLKKGVIVTIGNDIQSEEQLSNLISANAQCFYHEPRFIKLVP
jgi:hypothetical protein